LWFRQFTSDVKLADLQTCRHFRRIASKAKPDTPVVVNNSGLKPELAALNE
jgi:hypothetical protein